MSKVKGQGWPFNEDRGKQTVDLSFLFGVYVKIQSARLNCLKGQKISKEGLLDLIKYLYVSDLTQGQRTHED